VSNNDTVTVTVEFEPAYLLDDDTVEAVQHRYDVLVGIRGEGGEFDRFADGNLASMWTDDVSATPADFDAFGVEMSGRGEVRTVTVVIEYGDSGPEIVERTYAHGRPLLDRSTELVPAGAADLANQADVLATDVRELRDLVTAGGDQYADLRRVLDLFDDLALFVKAVG
jgi:hypothetical protein